MTVPSVGRVVHYVTPHGECTAAIVSKIHSETMISLTTFPLTGPNVVTSVAYNGEDEPEPAGNTWHWPERV
jgi:hypothetical protein